MNARSLVSRRIPVAVAALLAIALAAAWASPALRPFDAEEWSVRCWNGETRRWEDLGIEKMSVASGEDATRITNTSGIHRHAHLVYPAVPEGDFTFEIELRGGYELGFLNAEGKDEMLYLELVGRGAADADRPALEDLPFLVYEISREGTRHTIRRDGRGVPLVHFHFDYGEPFVITLAIRDGESAEIRSAAMRRPE